MAIKALEKQIPKKPRKSVSGIYFICPYCERLIEKNENLYGNIDIPCCKFCGQALDWSEE